MGENIRKREKKNERSVERKEGKIASLSVPRSISGRHATTSREKMLRS